jgi:hypothetical protein
MPPKRRVPNRIPVEEANERDRVAQLEQQMAQITEQLATLLANQNPNQNPFQALNPNGGDVEDESDEEESDPSLFYDETCLSEEVFADLDLPPVFDEEIFDKESMSVDFDLPPVFDEEIFDKESMRVEFDLLPVSVEEIFEKESDLKIQELASIYWCDWMDVMTKIGKYTVRCRRTCELTLHIQVILATEIRGRIFSNLERMMQQEKMIRKTKVWISWRRGIDSKTKGPERRKQRLGMFGTVRIGKFRGPEGKRTQNQHYNMFPKSPRRALQVL